MKTICFFHFRFLLCRKFIVLSLVSCFLVLDFACTSKEPFKMVEFSGIETLCNFSRIAGWNQMVADSMNASAILCCDNDLLSCSDVLLVYNPDFPWAAKNVLTYDDYAVYINKNIYALNITSQTDMTTWFESMDENGVATLQFLIFESPPRKEYLPFLEKLAAIKPDVGFCFDNGVEGTPALWSLFHPRYVTGFNVSPGNLPLLNQLTNLELLWVVLDSEGEVDPLPALPKLKQLFIEVPDNQTLPVEFLVHNRQIEKVVVVGEGNLDVDLLLFTHLKKLKTLAAFEVDSFIHPQLINSHPHIESLHLCSCPHPEALNLPRLRWMTFTGAFSQEQFDHFLTMHPRLEVVELDNRKIQDLHRLAELNRLKGLSIADTVTDVATVKSLARLEFLSLPTDYLENSNLVAELHQAMPHTRLVGNEGFCLGTGWLLLLLPLIVLFSMISSIQKRKKEPEQWQKQG